MCVFAVVTYYGAVVKDGVSVVSVASVVVVDDDDDDDDVDSV